MGFEIEASHHEVADSQHEIDFKYGDALVTADRVYYLQICNQVDRSPVRLARELHGKTNRTASMAAVCTRMGHWQRMVRMLL